MVLSLPLNAEVGEVGEEAVDFGFVEEHAQEFVDGGDALGELVGAQGVGVREQAGFAGAGGEIGDLAFGGGLAGDITTDGRADAIDELGELGQAGVGLDQAGDLARQRDPVADSGDALGRTLAQA